MAAEPAPAPVRRRRRPEEAVREILAAAEAALREAPFRELRVEELTRRTGMTRSTFYHYFRSLDEVAITLLRAVQAEMLDAARPWIDAPPEADVVAAVGEALGGVAEVYGRHGPVLAAIHEASFHHDAVRAAWRDGVVEDWIRAVAEQLRRQREAGATQVDDPDEVSRALLLMNTAVFIERLGTPPADPPAEVARTLTRIWVGALYPGALAAPAPSGPAARPA